MYLCPTYKARWGTLLNISVITIFILEYRILETTAYEACEAYEEISINTLGIFSRQLLRPWPMMKRLLEQNFRLPVVVTWYRSGMMVWKPNSCPKYEEELARWILFSAY
jgi:hypothetical protein